MSRRIEVLDVLMSYAVTAMIVAWLIGRSDRAVRAWMIAVGALHVLVVGLLTAVIAGDAPSPTPPPLSSPTGSWTDQVLDRIVLAPVYRNEAVFIVALGLLGLITTVAYRFTAVPGLLRTGLTAVGRTALSCCVFQNLGGRGALLRLGLRAGRALCRRQTLVGDRRLDGHLRPVHDPGSVLATPLHPRPPGVALATAPTGHPSRTQRASHHGNTARAAARCLEVRRDSSGGETPPARCAGWGLPCREQRCLVYLDSSVLRK